MGMLGAWAVPAQAGMITVSYTADAGGSNTNPLNGLAALATFETSGSQLNILLKNSSTGIPANIGTANSLLVSLGMNLPTGITIVSGNTAVVGPGSNGLAQWSSKSAGSSVAEEWAWTNAAGGDLLAPYKQVITTSSGNNQLTRFGGGSASISGPYGGIAAKPALANIPGSQRAVSDSIQFVITLSGALTDAQLAELANSSIVEYGSDARYLRVPEPASLCTLGFVALAFGFRRRRSA